MEDKRFLERLLEMPRSENSLVWIIDTVEIAGSEGGNRGRLMRFGSGLEGESVRIRLFADADTDRVLQRQIPKHVWITDHRDMEGYCLRVECFHGVVEVIQAIPPLSALNLLDSVMRIGRRVGQLRVLSDSDRLRLAFQRTQLKPRLSISGNAIVLDEERYLQVLLQNSRFSLKRVTELMEGWDSIESALQSVTDLELIHGHDAEEILAWGLDKAISARIAGKLLRSTFQSGLVDPQSTLQKVITYLS
ncbi:hypothetical protein IIA16_02130 [bacterium]|nr:hypothetical protein [bacterium]